MVHYTTTPLSAAAIEKLSNAVTVITLKKGAVLLEQDEVCDHIYFIEKGYLRTLLLKDGLEINTAFHFENEYCTNLKSLRTGAPSDVIIRAGEPCILHAFNKHILLSLYAASPEIAAFGRDLLEQLLMVQEEHANLFKLYTPAERYQYIVTHHPRIIQRVSLSQLSSYLGIARETISRIRKQIM